MTELFGIYFGAAHRIIWAPLFIATAIFLFIRYKNIKNFSLSIAHKNNHKIVFKNFSITIEKLKLFCMFGALLFLFLALLQPQWDKKDQFVDQEGRDLLVVLDISKSMLAKDIKPSRLEFVKLKLKALLKMLKFERVGLVLFSGSAFIQCPLTVDYSTFTSFLDQVDTENISSGTTAIDQALNKSVELFAQYPARKSKIVLLVTDGEDFSLNLPSAEQVAKQEGLKIIILGAGTPEGAPIPKVDPAGNQIGLEREKNGTTAISKLNETLLKNIAASLEGNYIRVSYNDSDIDYITALVNKFEMEKFGNRNFSAYEDKYPWFLGISAVLFLIESVI
jgi:Ca-activated chloride channel homolog